MTRAGTCVHFNGMGFGANKCCEAGVNYRELVGGPDLGWCTRAPCIKVGMVGRDLSAVVGCEQYAEPTAEQIAESERQMQELLRRMELVAPLISRIKKQHRGHSWTGVEECPACKGRLHFSHAATNGHVWGRCETADCLQWMD